MKPESKTKSKIELLKERSRIAEEGGGKARLDKQKAAGKMTANAGMAGLLGAARGLFQRLTNWGTMALVTPLPLYSGGEGQG